MENKSTLHPPRDRRIVFKRFLSQALLLLAVAGGVVFYFSVHDPEDETTLHRFGQSLVPDDPATSGLPGGSAFTGEDATSPDAPFIPGTGNATGGTNSSQPPRLTGSPEEDFPEELDDLSYYAPVPVQFPRRSANSSPSRAAPQRTGSSRAEAAKSAARPPATATAPTPAPADPAPAVGQSTVPPATTVPGRPGSPMRALPPGEQQPVPFEGKSLDETAAELSAAFSGRASGNWGENLAGVVSRLDDLVFTRTLWPDTSRENQGPVPFVLSLTFDACDGAKNRFDAELIAFLRERRIPATPFVTSTWIKRYTKELLDLAAYPRFEMAAHGERHRPCSVDGKSAYGIKGTASMRELVREVLANARVIQAATGNYPRWFRSGTAHYDELAVQVINTLGMRVAGYSIAGDQGATLPAAQVAARTLAAHNGDILLFHMNKPGSGTREGLRQALPQLQERGTVFVRLSDTL